MEIPDLEPAQDPVAVALHRPNQANRKPQTPTSNPVAPGVQDSRRLDLPQALKGLAWQLQPVGLHLPQVV